MCYAMMCYVSHDVCIRYTVLSCSVQPACLCVGSLAEVPYCMYIHTHIVQTIAPHLLSLSLLLYILYNIYTTTIHIPNTIFVYIILCHMKRLCYTPTLVYITLCYTMCIYALSHYDI